MSLEGDFAAALGLTLATSAGVALRRRRTERARRAGLNGTRVLDDGRGGLIEYLAEGPTEAGTPVVVLENGLGAPLEGWDWVARELRPRARVIRYHRRGYGRTTSDLTPAAAVDLLLKRVGCDGEIHLVAHSIGALVSAWVLAESERVRSRAASLTLVDPTDGDVLDQERADRRKVAFNAQVMAQDALGSVTGLDRWGINRLAREVEYRPDIQEAFVTFSLMPGTLRTARREYRQLDTRHQRTCRALQALQVLSASEDEAQQRRFADRVGARFSVVPGSSHRSLIGRLECAQVVAAAVEEVMS